MRDPIHAVAGILARTRTRYALIGGHAVNAWLEPRFTADIDITLAGDPAELAAVRAAFAAEGYRVEREHGVEQPSGPDFVRLASADGTSIVEFQVAKTEFQDEVLRRAKEDRFGVRVATPEDLIILKLLANRQKDQIDLHGLVKLPDLDWAHIERWCAAWDLGEELRALREGP